MGYPKQAIFDLWILPREKKWQRLRLIIQNHKNILHPTETYITITTIAMTERQSRKWTGNLERQGDLVVKSVSI